MRKAVGILTGLMVFFIPSHCVAVSMEGRGIYSLLRLSLVMLYLGICIKNRKKEGKPLGVFFWVLTIYLSIVLVGTVLTLIYIPL